MRLVIAFIALAPSTAFACAMPHRVMVAEKQQDLEAILADIDTAAVQPAANAVPAAPARTRAALPVEQPVQAPSTIPEVTPNS
jgi:hypothetical protein